MVRVPKGMVQVGLARLVHLPGVELDAYWMDRYEVTNRQYKEFVDAGGYRRPELWRRSFVRGNREIGFDEAMKAFVDAAGRQGQRGVGGAPSGATILSGVGGGAGTKRGIRRIRQKQLPTVYHWSGRRSWAGAEMTPLSNIDRGEGSARRPQRPAITWNGAYDMAGGVKEWCANDDGAAGGTYSAAIGTIPPTCSWTSTRSPWERGATFGFRCMDADRGAAPAAALGPLRVVFRDYGRETISGRSSASTRASTPTTRDRSLLSRSRSTTATPSRSRGQL
jgi:formylglycine-generating enzyme required for sulfatase activity